VYPIAPYYSRPLERAGLLLGYSGLTPNDLAEATRRLGAVLREIPSR
jgi:DNA-binding transcriptional MocR family regulator